MGKWLKDFQALIWAATIAVGLISYAYQSFATKEFVNTKHESVMGVLSEIRESVKTIDDRTYELARRKQ